MEDQKEIEATAKNKKIWLFVGAFFCLATIILTSIILVVINKAAVVNKIATFIPAAKQTDKNEKPTDLVRRYLDGVYVALGEENNYPVAIMIDNFPDARPESSLARASIVYEAEAEGGVTRYLAIFSDLQNIKSIGPIRSARPYYVDWAEEYSAVYTHCGGSPDALVKIIKDNVIDFNEFYNGSYFYREQRKAAPHNVYITGELITSFLKKNSLEKGKFLTWNFKDDAVLTERPQAATIRIDFPGDDYKVEWRYNQLDNFYERYLAGKLHTDEDGKKIQAKNIIVQYIPAEEVDDKLRLDMKTVGEGKALVCLDGKCQEGKWQKKNTGSRTRFYDSNNNEFTFNTGTTWIEIVQPGYKVEF